MRVTLGAVGKITLNWIPKFNPHTFFSSIAGDADDLPGSVRREPDWHRGDQQWPCMNNFVKM